MYVIASKAKQSNLPKLTWLCLATTLIFASTFATANSTRTTDTQFEQALSEVAQSENAVGFAVAVVRNGKITLVRTYGKREAGRPEKVDANTTFRIASLSKGFAATIAAKLVSENKLALETPIVRYNKDFRLSNQAQTEAATISDVLSHRLSLPPYAYDNLLEADTAPPVILREMRKVKPVCRVGSCYAYQNVGFDMITGVIEELRLASFAEVVREELFKPLGMKGASFDILGLKADSNWARSHRRIGQDAWKVREVRQAYYNVPAAGGINASILDMAEWLKAQMGHAPNVISPELLEMLHDPIVRTPAELRRNRRMTELSDAHYGLGWRIYQYGGHTVINHSGSVEGYGARIAFLPEKDVGIVLLANFRTREFWDLLPTFLNLELGLVNERSKVPAE